MGRIALVLGLVLALLLTGIGVFTWWQGRGATQQLATEASKAGTATVSAGQADAATQALRTKIAGEARDRLADQTHEENRNAILQAPGAELVLDPGFVERLDDGLCRYAAYRADPGCPGLRPADSAVLPDAGPAGPAP